MAGANRGRHPRAASEHHENADPNDGSHDGCMGGADQITQPDERPVGDAVEAKILARRAGRHLAQRRRFGRGRAEPDAVLGAVGRTMPESLGRRGGSWHRWTAPPLKHSTWTTQRRLLNAAHARQHSYLGRLEVPPSWM